jgi:hypothetical protein
MQLADRTSNEEFETFCQSSSRRQAITRKEACRRHLRELTLTTPLLEARPVIIKIESRCETLVTHNESGVP